MSMLGAAPTITSVAAPTMIGLAATFITVWWGGGVAFLGLAATALIVFGGPAFQFLVLVLAVLELLEVLRCFRVQAVVGNALVIMPLNAILLSVYYLSWPLRLPLNHAAFWAMTRICSIFTDRPSCGSATVEEFIRGVQVGMRAILLGADALDLDTHTVYQLLERFFGWGMCVLACCSARMQQNRASLLTVPFRPSCPICRQNPPCKHIRAAPHTPMAIVHVCDANGMQHGLVGQLPTATFRSHAYPPLASLAPL